MRCQRHIVREFVPDNVKFRSQILSPTSLKHADIFLVNFTQSEAEAAVCLGAPRRSRLSNPPGGSWCAAHG